MANRLEQLNDRFRQSSVKPRISGMSLHFIEGGNAQVSVTVSIGRSGFGFGSIVLGLDDKRLDPIYNLIEEVINDSATR